MNYARIIDATAYDVTTIDPTTLFTPEVAAQFEVVPDEVQSFWRLIDGVWTAPEPQPEPEPMPEPTPEDQLVWAKAAKLAEIIAGSNACAAQVKGRYSELEIDSWAIQQTQAETVLSGGSLPADALLSVLAAANGVPVADFAQRVMTNVATAEAVTKLVVSQQQAYETRLKTIMAETALDDDAKIAAIQTIEVKYELPEA